MTSASADQGTSYGATLTALNHATGSGMLSLTLNGTQATITEHWAGLAPTFGGAAYPHVQHIHVGAKGICPTMSADENADGVISTTEGNPSYGGIGTTLSVSGDTSPAASTNLQIAPAGPSLDYSRTITLSNDVVQSIKSGTAVIVVHGLDPATLSKKAQGEKSDLVPSLPLAATSPALCGALSAWPTAPQTGNGSTAGTENLTLFGLGGGLLAAAGAATVLARRRTAVEVDNQR
ncbi:MAG: hypothetical protein WKF54_11445 [Nocardioidaceae bacterium]